MDTRTRKTDERAPETGQAAEQHSNGLAASGANAQLSTFNFQPSTVPPSTAFQPSRPTGRALAAILAGLMLTLFLAALDGTIVGTALPSIVAELQGFERYSWVATAYLLAQVASIPIISKLSDMYGRKWLLVITVAGFVAASGLCGAAQTMDQLIAFRTIQGLFGGGLFSLVFSAMADLFSPAERGKWMGLFFAMFGLASIAGPLAGGLITEHASWRWVFYVNLPFGFAALAVLVLGFPKPGPARGSWRQIDFPGAIAIVVASTALLLGLVIGGQRFDFLTPTVLGLLGLALAAFFSFLVIERRAADPVIPLGIFRHRAVATGVTLNLLAGILMFGVLLYTPLYAQAVLGDSPTAAGALLIPMVLTMMIGNTVVGRIVSHFGRYKPVMLVGCVLLPLGTLSLTLLGAEGNRFLMLAGLFASGLGLSFWMPPSNLAVQNAVPQEQVGVITGATTLLRTIGQTLGSALIGAIVIGTYTLSLPGKLPASAGRIPTETLQELTNPEHLIARESAAGAGRSLPAGVDPAVANDILGAVNLALFDGIHNGYLGALVCAVLGALLVAVFMPDLPLRGHRRGG